MLQEIKKRQFNYPGGAACLSLDEKQGTVILKIQLSYTGVYGMGEKYNALNQKGSRVVNAVEEHFCEQGEKTYCPAPFFFTDSGFGLFVDTGEITVFEFGEEITVKVPARAAYCKVYLFAGLPAEIISDYMPLFGSAKLPPKWAFGPWISANHWNSQDAVEKQIQNLEKNNFPATVLVAEAWSDEATFYIFNGAKYTPKGGGAFHHYEDFDFSESPWPNPKGMIERLHAAGLHLILWQIPVYKAQNKTEKPCPQHDQDIQYAAEHGLCVMELGGNPYRIPAGNWFALSMIPDFTNPLTKRLWFAKRQYLLDIGVDGFKTDGGEFIYQEDIGFYNGYTGAEMKNRYAQSYTSAYTEFLPPGKTLFSRAGYSGQHTTPILWAGDQKSSFEELQSQLRAGLSAALSGIPFWGFDIAGFAGPLPGADLYLRATQMACFSPIMQWHSEPDGGQFRELLSSKTQNNERSPWNIAEVSGDTALLEKLRFYHILRMNLLPYIYSEAVDVVQNNTPLMRPLLYDFPYDKKTFVIEDEYMFGRSLLVAPVLKENAADRPVYLPEGLWYDLFSGDFFTGGGEVSVFAGGKIPVYIRSGCGIALNVGDDHALGSFAGNRMTPYRKLHFLLAGSHGSYHFSDDIGNDLTLQWQNNNWNFEGIITSDFTVKIVR
ncbi:hypothetical protein FACS1894163_02320 [Spirochaetia bacterium]|nr:hypothetical protein FACS1894163_02320 [Spirochaetia bacterium]